MDGPLPEGHPLLNLLRRKELAVEAFIEGDFITMIRPDEKLAARYRMSEPVLRMLRAGEWKPGTLEFLAPQGEDRLEWVERGR